MISQSRITVRITRTHTNHSQDLMDAQKYHVTLKSGRTFILNSGYDVYETAWEAYEEAALMDDYLVDVQPIGDL